MSLAHSTAPSRRRSPARSVWPTSTKSKRSATRKTVAAGKPSIRNYTAFRVEDDTASALVDPRQADFRFSAERSTDVRGGQSPPQHVQEFIRQNEDVGSEEQSLDLKLFELNTGKDRKYIERRLDVGESVHILGEARYDAAAGNDAGEVNSIIGNGDTQFLISDTDEQDAGRRMVCKGLPYALAGILFFVIGGFILGM